MSTHASFWLLIWFFFLLWTVRVLYLPTPGSDTMSGFLINTLLRILFFLLPFVIAIYIISKDSIREAFALQKATVTGWILALLYSGSITLYEVMNRTVSPTTNLWLLLNFPFAPVIEELVFRGYMFTKLLKVTGKIQTVLLTSVLFTLIHVPGWIFLLELKGENFLAITGQVFIFSLFQGAIRLFGKSVLPNIAVHLINNFFSMATD